jgi:hypothetical protein
MSKELEIYFPMTCNVLTPGHIFCLEKLIRMGFVNIGLLTPKALKGYKEERMPFEDRKYILETVAIALGSIDVHPQDSLDPTENIKRLKCNALASGDGFERVESSAIKKLKLKQIDIKLPGEINKKYSSSKI